MRVIAMYLPQFHECFENNKWWGDGYTEWTAVKNAEALFKDHYQPRKPLNDNYYDLLKHDAMKEQAELVNRYHLDGLCFYHYYFKAGRKILNQPAENLLEWSDIEMPFCFSWANESWIRTWSRITTQSNNWTTIYAGSGDDSGSIGVLVEQAYGFEAEWIDHFYYLLPFFKDSRYIREEGHPVFVIYKPEDLYCFKEMKKCWDDLADKEGMERICFISTNSIEEGYDSMMLQEPQNTFERNVHDYNCSKPMIVEYERVWEDLLNKKCREGTNLGCFVDYDDSPRHGRNGKIITGATPEKFEYYFLKLMNKAENCCSKFIFINAWNEWGEGMYLEPDARYGYQYLEALSKAIVSHNVHGVQEDYKELFYVDDSSGEDLSYYSTDDIVSLKKNKERYYYYTGVYSRWLGLKLDNIDISEKLIKRGFRNVAIYGMAMIGRLLVKELEKSEINIAYGIDQFEKSLHLSIPIYSMNDFLPEVDLIIVTLGTDTKNIIAELRKKCSCYIIRIGDLLREL